MLGLSMLPFNSIFFHESNFKTKYFPAMNLKPLKFCPFSELVIFETNQTGPIMKLPAAQSTKVRVFQQIGNALMRVGEVKFRRTLDIELEDLPR